MSWPDGKRFVADTCKHYPYGVPRGEELQHLEVCDASALFIGEAPGSRENAKGRPFVGPSGFLWERELLRPVGLERGDFYVTNVVPFQPPANKIEAAWGLNKDVMLASIAALKTKYELFRGSLVVPTGNTALSATLGLRGIMKWRGSVLARSRGFVVPTIHPASALRQHLLLKTMRHDWQRIAQVLQRGWQPPPINLIATKHNDKRLEELRHARVLSFDIETPIATPKVLCVSFCADYTTSYSIDCRFGIPPIVRELLESNIPKVAQNGSFDCYILALNDVVVRNFLHDTSLMFHALDNNVGPTAAGSGDKSIIKPYSLAYMASIFTPFTYWKDSAKDDGSGEAYGAYKSNWQRFQEYNAMDSLGTLWIARELLHRLKETGRYAFYREHYATLIEPLLQLSMRGVRFDTKGAAERVLRLGGELEALRDSLTAMAGTPLHGTKRFKREPKLKEGRRDGLRITFSEAGGWIGHKSSLSNKVLHEHLYKTLKLKPQLKDGKLTADEVAIRNLLLYIKEGGDSKRRWKGAKDATSSLLEGILKFRETEKTAQFLAADAVDSDGRIRAAYSLLTQTGRLRSYANPRGTGFNLQNIQRDVRHFFLPDTAEQLGCNGEEVFFLEIDLKQAEDLVVKAMSASVSGDDRPLELVRSVWTGEVDIHKRLAAAVFGVRQADVTYEQRYVSKRCRHAKNNGMQPKRLQTTLLKDGFVKTLFECTQIADAIDAAEPWVLKFHAACRQAVMRQKCVSTSWDWRLDFTDEDAAKDSGVFRRAYAFIQQSEIGVLMKQWGLRTYAAEIAPHFKSRLNMLVHDNVVLSVPRSELFDVASILYAALVRERSYGVRVGVGSVVPVRSIGIPAELKISRTLSCTCKDCKAGVPPLELSAPGTREDFERRVETWLLKQQAA